MLVTLTYRGKTIMAGLHMKEPMLWNGLERCMVVMSGGLVEQDLHGGAQQLAAQGESRRGTTVSFVLTVPQRRIISSREMIEQG